MPSLGTSESQSVQNRFTVGFTRSVTDANRSLYLGDDASREGLVLGRSIPVTLTTTLTGSLDFGMDLSKPTLDEAFFVKINNLTASASATLSPTSLVNLPLLGRFLKLDVSSGNLSLGANVTVQSSADISLKSFSSTPVANLINVSSSSGYVSGGFSVSAKLFEGTLSQVVYSGSINFSDTNIFDNTRLMFR